MFYFHNAPCRGLNVVQSVSYGLLDGHVIVEYFKRICLTIDVVIEGGGDI